MKGTQLDEGYIVKKWMSYKRFQCKENSYHKGRTFANLTRVVLDFILGQRLESCANHRKEKRMMSNAMNVFLVVRRTFLLW